ASSPRRRAAPVGRLRGVGGWVTGTTLVSGLQRKDEVGGQEDAQHLALRVDDEVLRARRLAQRVEQRLAVEVRFEDQAGYERSAQLAGRHPGLALHRGGGDPRLVDDSLRVPVLVGDCDG